MAYFMTNVLNVIGHTGWSKQTLPVYEPVAIVPFQKNDATWVVSILRHWFESEMKNNNRALAVIVL